MNKKFDSLSILALISTALIFIITVVGYITVIARFNTYIDVAETITYLDSIKANGQIIEVIQTFIMMPIALLVSAGLFLDCFLRKEVSHIGVTFAVGCFATIYSLVNMIGGFLYSGVASIFFYGAATIGAVAMTVFFIKKMLDGDVTLGFKISAGAFVVLGFFAVCVTYPFLEAYSHAGDSLFWTGGFFGLAVLILAGIAITVSALSDYDPNPIEIDEFGNPIDDNK
ncbi:MAG: hypothetical protein MJ220_01270 [Bacilli bacterium]|nr:hypothetical protein [Bacilli bacterium]